MRIRQSGAWCDIFKRQRCIILTLTLCLLCNGILIQSAVAGNLTINFGGLSNPNAAPPAVVPTNPQDKVSADTVRTTVLTTTDIQTPAATPVPAGTTSVGVEATVTSDKQILNLPLSYSIGPKTALAATVPLAIVKTKTPGGDEERNWSIGDVSVTLKQRFGDENDAEYQVLFTSKFASGDSEKGLGTGAHDFGFTGKIIKRYDIHRITAMANYTFSQNNPLIAGQEIKYGDKWSTMAAYDINVAKLLRIWLSARMVTTVINETTVNGIPQGDKLSTVDFMPEIKYFFSNDRALSLGVNIPVTTKYDVANAQSRQSAVTFGFYSLF